jgi:hypothetical protein
MAGERPIGVTILAILSLLGVAAAIIHTLQMLHIFPIVIGQVKFFTFDLLGALLWGVMVLIYIWVFNMLWNLNPQGWIFVVIVAVLNIIFAIVSAFGGSSWEAMAVPILINGVIILYCFMPGVKDAFQVP